MKTDKRATMADIARQLGISKNAVSLALNGKSGVSEQLRVRVVETARKMEYTGFTQHTMKGCILALIPGYLSSEDNSTFYHQVCFCMETYAQSRGYQLIISSVSEQDEQALASPPLLNNIYYTGIMTIGNLSLAYCRMISSLGLRYVMVDQYYDELNVNSVTTANVSGAYMLTRHLIEKGHKRIEYFGKRHTTSSLNDRWRGYCRAMREFGLPIRDNLYQHDQKRGQENDAELIRHALTGMKEMPTAALCGHDNTAAALIRVVEGWGLSIPRDISVVGFDDIQRPDIFELKLTTYQTQKEGIARTAIDLFSKPEDYPRQKISIHGECVFRESVRKLNVGGKDCGAYAAKGQCVGSLQ